MPSLKKRQHNAKAIELLQHIPEASVPLVEYSERSKRPRFRQ